MSSSSKTELSTRANGNVNKDMDLVSKYGQTVQDTKANGDQTKHMARANFGM